MLFSLKFCLGFSVAAFIDTTVSTPSTALHGVCLCVELIGVRWRDSDNIIGPANRSPCDDSTECIPWSHTAELLHRANVWWPHALAVSFFWFIFIIRAVLHLKHEPDGRGCIGVDSMERSVHRMHIVLHVAEADGMFCYWSYKLVMLFVRTKNERRALFNGKLNEKRQERKKVNWEPLQNWKSTRTSRRHVWVFILRSLASFVRWEFCVASRIRMGPTMKIDKYYDRVFILFAACRCPMLSTLFSFLSFIWLFGDFVRSRQLRKMLWSFYVFFFSLFAVFFFYCSKQ